jgi:hypothetical protein
MVLTKKIIFNPENLKNNNRKSEKERKKIPTGLNKSFKANNLKKQLLNKIKEHQEKLKTKDTGIINNKNNNKNNNKDNNEFKNEFESSLDYLHNAMNYRKKSLKNKNKIEKENKIKTAISNSLNNSIYRSTTPVDTGEMEIKEDTIENFTSKNKISNNIFKPKPLANIPINLPISKPVIENPIVETPIAEKPVVTNENSYLNNILKKQPVYSCLKGGTKETYSQYKNRTLKNNKQINNIKIENNPISYTREKFINRKNKLDMLKSKFQENNNVQQVPKRVKTLKRKKTRRFTLGKNNNKVSILINSETKKDIEFDIQALKTHSISDIKKYLKEKNLIKAGSTAPEIMLRQLYEAVVLTGNINNTSDDVFMHNYINKD